MLNMLLASLSLFLRPPFFFMTMDFELNDPEDFHSVRKQKEKLTRQFSIQNYCYKLNCNVINRQTLWLWCFSMRFVFGTCLAQSWMWFAIETYFIWFHWTFQEKCFEEWNRNVCLSFYWWIVIEPQIDNKFKINRSSSNELETGDKQQPLNQVFAN